MSGDRLRTIAFLTVLALLAPSVIASSATFAGRTLNEALQELQRQGVNLVFSSNVVRPDMMVDKEPAAMDPRKILDELLAPHGLEVREGAGDILVVISQPGQAARDQSSIIGLVRSRLGAEPLRGTTLRLQPSDLEATSGADGSFRFDNLPIGTYTVVAIQRGFVVERLEEVAVVAHQSTEISILLDPAPLTEEVVVVTPSKVSLLREQPIGFFALSREELLALPHLGNDFFRALSLLPGITSNDVTAQFHVRGGRRDETQILLDGQELFDSYHLQDFDNALSVVVPETISRVDLSTGGFPVEYGDRMSGVLDMTTATPTGAPRGRVALGILSAQAGGAGSFRDQRGGWIAQLRRGTTDFAGRIFDTDAPRYWDAFGKVEYQLDPRNKLRLNLLHTDDKYQIEELIDGDFKSFKTNYRSSYAWLTHQAILGSSTFMESALSISRVDRDRNGLEIEDDFEFLVSDLRDMEVLGLRQGWNHQLTPAHALRGGFELRDFDTEFEYLRSPRADGSDGTTFDNQFRENHFGVYVADGWQISEPLRLELGLRYDRYTLTSEGLVSPRLNLLYGVGDKSAFRLAVGEFNQSQRPYELQVEDGEVDFSPVERSEHWIVGFDHLFETNGPGPDLAFRVEVYRRNVDNPRPRYENLFEPLNTFPEVEPDRIRIAPGRSLAQGIETFLRGTFGSRLGWWVNYAYATTEDEIDGEWVPRRFDQPNTLNLDLDYRLGENWRFNLAGRYHTGWPTTPIGLEEVENEEGEMETELVIGPLNSQRLADYHRLDLRVSRIWGFGFGVLTVFVDIQNLLNHRNAAGFDVIFDEEDGSLTVDQEYWVGFFPSAGVILEFW